MYNEETYDCLTLFVFGDGSTLGITVPTPKPDINSLLDDYIDYMTLYELFGDESYKWMADEVLRYLERI
jgi:hypothetical protein